jgi:uncharacterized membrane protein
MSDAPVQLIVAAFNDPNKAGQLMDELKAGKKQGLVGIIDAAVVVKDEKGKLKIQDAKRRSTKGLVTGGVVGGALGLLLGPVGWAAVAGGAIGALAGKLSGAPLKAEMKDIGESLTPNSSAIVAVIEHTWVAQLEEALAAEGARLVREALKADIAAQLEADGSVVYTAVDNTIARLAASPEGVEVSGLYLGDDEVALVDAHFTTAEETQDLIEGTATPISEEATA